MTALRTERATRALRVGGLTPLSTTDWPGELAAVVFCQGCPWRCGYCHNPHLLPSRGATEIGWDDVLAFLRRRRGLLDGVVFSGGEPLAQSAIVDAIRSARRLGFRIGLHTAGAYPRRLADVLRLLDWVGFDIKAGLAAYTSITGVAGSGAAALESAKLVLDNGIAYEFRTTVHPRQLTAETVVELATQLASLGVRHYALQEFRAGGCADAELDGDSTPSFLSESFAGGIAPLFETLELRRSA